MERDLQTTKVRGLTFTESQIRGIILAYWFSAPPDSLAEANEQITQMFDAEWRQHCDREGITHVI